MVGYGIPPLGGDINEDPARQNDELSSSKDQMDGLTASKRRLRARSLGGDGPFFGGAHNGVRTCNKATYDMVERYFRDIGADKPIHSVLVANNGNAATKFTMSIRKWCQTTFGDAHAISIVAMASPEDLQIGAEYIRMADQIIDVPGGPSNNNYGNASLIVETAEQACVDAVWPGWGHASENPDLPLMLSKCTPEIRFLGPPSDAMSALGDKIGSTILAQAAGVPTIPWSGTGVAVSFEECNGNIPPDVYDRACVQSVEDAVEQCREIGYPVMLKASWGGGGKGIRKVTNDAEAATGFQQVQAELPGSPIFAMKLAPKSRHIEVQLMCDRHGNVTSLYSRDCSTQRRHQKIVEEGPVTVAPEDALLGMEASARSLARSVGYQGVATLEYLYAVETGEYYFLELNPRLQVEHPVTERITGVNIPACQLLIGAGVPLHRIPDIRRFYQRDVAAKDPIAFETEPRRPPLCHCIAVRITCEDPDKGFKPTCGSITELSFRPSPEVWGYFSVKAGGAVHEFADSQIGHLFASGETRADAIRVMLGALREVRVRGEICTIVGYVTDMLQHPDWAGDNISTAWLDARIAAQVQQERPPWHQTVVCGAALKAWHRILAATDDFIERLKRGQHPAAPTTQPMKEDLVIDGEKFQVLVERRGKMAIRVHLNGTHADATMRPLSDGGLLVQMDGRSHVVHSEEEHAAVRLQIDGRMAWLHKERDPSKIVSASSGKLIRFLVPSGESVKVDQPVAEVEVMKMVMSICAEASGVLHHDASDGAILTPGAIIARIDLEDPNSVQSCVLSPKTFPALGPPTMLSADAHRALTEAVSSAEAVLEGFAQDEAAVVEALRDCLEDPLLPALQAWGALTPVEKRIPAELVGAMKAVLGEFSKQVEAYDDGVALRAPVFPCDEIETLFEAAIQSAGGPADRKALENNLVAVRATVRAHAAGLAAYEGAVVRGILARFVATEDAFQTEDDHVLEALNARHGGDLQAIHAAYLSHANLPRKAALVRVLLSTFACKDPGPYRPLLRRIATMSGPTLVDLSTLARTLHDHSNLLDLRRGVWRALHAVIAPDSHGEAAGSSGPSKLAARRSTMTDGVFDGLGPLAMRPLRRASTQPDAEWAVSRRLTQNEPSRFSLDPAVAGGAASTCVTDTVAVPGMAPEDVCEDLISAQAAVDEALASLAGADALGRLAMTTFVRRMYHTFLTSGPEEVPDTASQGIPACTWSFTGLPSAGNSTGATERGFLAVVSSAADVEKAAAVAQAVLGAGGEATVHLIVTEPRQEPQEADAQCNGHLLSEKPKQHAITGTGDVPHAVVAAAQACMTPLHETAGVTCVSLCSPGGAHGLSSVTLRWAGAVGTLSPDDAQGATPAPLGRILEVARAPRDARSAVSRNMQILLLSSAERPRPNSKPVVRAFVRGVVRSVPQHAALDLSSDTLGPQDSSFEPKGSTGGPLSAAMDAVASCKRQLKVALTELAVREFPSAAGKTQKASWAHVFLSVLPPTPLPDPTADLQGAEGAVSAVRSACVRLVAALSRDVQRASVAEIEMRLRSSCPGVEAWRVLVHTPTGTVASEDDIEVTAEIKAPDGSPALISACGPAAAPAPLLPHPPMAPIALKRLAARDLKTTYCYDVPDLVEGALRALWSERLASGESEPAMPPGRLSKFQEVSLSDSTQSFASSALVLTPVSTPPGHNDIGMVAWRATLKTPDAPSGRQVVVVANDITFQAGTFGPKEDAVFRAAVEESLSRRVPVLYVAANAGARVGLAEEVKALVKVSTKGAGVDYLYLDDADYRSLLERAPGTVQAEAVDVDGQRRWRLTAVVGAGDGLGVECLSGAGATASVFSKAWDEGLTFTLVSGRSIGIGAYLARLGRRCAQRSCQPIILTGFQALNKLLQRQVYHSNLKLGGPQVMGANGVSNYVVSDDAEGMAAFLRWLSFTPAHCGGPVPIVPTSDPVDRPVAYAPEAGAKLDPRALIQGIRVDELGDGKWIGGIFDKGSFVESHPMWAKTVVTGRARLGGMSVGVIAVETSTVEKKIPADPGLDTSSEVVQHQAGQVWYPDSALKTAGALEEFSREGIPLVILGNWRGFSGGQADLFAGVLQSGSRIVEALRTYPAPVVVYLPPGAELRGGAWVVIDSQINADRVEMVADPMARGGVLEPEGIVEVKFRESDRVRLMHRSDARLAELKEMASRDPKAAEETKTREEALAPLYEQAALRFADLHDTPARMLAKSVISAVVPLRSVRAFLAARVRCRTAEARALDRLSQADPGVPVRVLRDRLRAAFLSRGDSGGAGSVWAAGGAWDSTADTALAQWLEGEGSLVVDRLAKQSAISRALATLRDSLGDSAESAVSALERVAEGA